MGLFSSIGSSLNKVFGVSDSQSSQYSYNEKLQKMSQDWQEQMSNTAYQRSVNDLTQAGLNPLLAYNSGGATTGTASAAGTGSGTGAAGSAAMPLISSLVNTLITGERDRNVSTASFNNAQAASTRVNTAQREFDLENQREMLSHMSDRERMDYQRLKYGGGYGQGASGVLNHVSSLLRDTFGFGSGNSSQAASDMNEILKHGASGYQSVLDVSDPEYPGSKSVSYRSDVPINSIWWYRNGRYYYIPIEKDLTYHVDQKD